MTRKYVIWLLDLSWKFNSYFKIFSDVMKLKSLYWVKEMPQPITEVY